MEVGKMNLKKIIFYIKLMNIINESYVAYLHEGSNNTN